MGSRLLLIATDGQSWGADLLSLRLCAQHGIRDPEWIAGWLGLKRVECWLDSSSGVLWSARLQGAPAHA